MELRQDNSFGSAGGSVRTMEVQQVLKNIEEKGYLLTPEALKAITTSENPQELAEIALSNAQDKMVIDINDLISKIRAKTVDAHPQTVVIQKTNFKPIGKEIDADVQIISKTPEDITGGSLVDFVGYFNARYEQMYPILQTRGQGTLTKIENLTKRRGEKVRIVALIGEKKHTKNGHILLRLEDPTGGVNALIASWNKDLLMQAATLVSDEAICVEGSMNKDLFIIKNFYEPDIPRLNTAPVKTIDEDIAVCMMSDIHVGSKLFMRKNFDNLLDWLHGRVGDQKQRELATKVKYITIAGDLVDGIGVYPGQEINLEITDIYEQYKAFSELMLRIPDWIQVIIAPGNHDAVRKSDPQPPLSPELVPDLYKASNFTMIGSPTTVSMHGMKELIYHGTSFSDFISELPQASYEENVKIMIEMLKKRHVHPIYGGKPITPEKYDKLMIEEVPDIFHTGESHMNCYEIYKGTICLNSGTWQGLTEFQVKHGQKPTPARLPVVELKYARTSHMHFDKLVT